MQRAFARVVSASTRRISATSSFIPATAAAFVKPFTGQPTLARTHHSTAVSILDGGHQHSSNCLCSYRRRLIRTFSATPPSAQSPTPDMAAPASSGLPESTFRLSRDIQPTHYKLGLKTDLKSLTFHGKVEIELDVKNTPSAPSSITLHAAPQLKIHTAVLSSTSLKTSQNIIASDIAYDSKLERITISFPEDVVVLQAGQKLTLALRFEGELEGSMMGYYKSAYELHDGTKAYYALTQFEPTAARRAFPCFDEPDFKATFSITLLSRKGLTVLSNMPVEHSFADVGEVALFPEEVTAAHEETHSGMHSPDAHHYGRELSSLAKGHAEMASDAAEGDGWVATTFQTTPIMSTYLVAWANGDFRHLQSSFTSPLTGRKVPLRIYATPEHIHQAALALEVKAKVLPVYEKIFDIEFPLPKLDTLVASDFDAGAMENWGLITGRTVVYLFDEKNGSVDARKLVASVQSHEVAHQWFGNIVTMRWWDNLWLNEAFATLMGEVISIAAVYPEWAPHSAFLNQHLKRALDLDSQRSSHPVEMPCPDPEMINQIFDAISYSKGASVLRMLSNMIGEETFLKGVSIYLKNHLYGNSRTADLWKGISDASGLDVAKIMANWTLKVGFPVITVEETKEGLKVRQNRFLSTGDPKPEEDETLWYVPLELKTVGKDGKVDIDHKAVLQGRETILPLEDAVNATYKLDAESAGVYRVLYSPERLAKLGDEASKGKKGAFSLNDRIKLVQDAFVLAKSGYGKTSGALNLISKLKSEEENLVWQEIAGGLSTIQDVWWEQPEPVKKALDKLMRDTFAPVAKKLGWTVNEKDSSDTREMRTNALAAIVKAGDEDALKEIRVRFSAFADQGDSDAIPGDFLDFIFANVVRFGGAEEYEKIQKIYKKPPTPQHKVACMRAMTTPRDPALIERTIEFMNSDNVKMQDMMYFYAGLSQNPYSRRRIWEQVQKDLPALVEKFKGNFSLGRLVQYSFDRFSTEKELQEVIKFFEDKDTKDYNQPLKQGQDAVRARIAWLGRDAQDVEGWLKENSYLA